MERKGSFVLCGQRGGLLGFPANLMAWLMFLRCRISRGFISKQWVLSAMSLVVLFKNSSDAVVGSQLGLCE